MPWKECNQMDEKLKFVVRLLDGKSDNCQEFDISRKTGYCQIRFELLHFSRHYF